MSRFRKLIRRLKEIERAVLLLANQEKIRCSECKREKYRTEYHDRQLKKESGFVCKICCDRKRNSSD